MNASHYYNILGLPENAGIREIKNAFRRKAKAYHPDINKEEGAHEKFVYINEAYTYLMNLHEGGAAGAVTGDEQDEHYRQWVQYEREKARRRAAKRARMRYEEFRRSSIYRTTSMLSHMLDIFLLALGMFIIIAAAVGLYNQGLYIEDNGDEVLNITGIVADIIITMAGILFITISWSNIKSYRKRSRKHFRKTN
ncbi:MAG: hypothetical protein EA408_02920 [Marinilabiliales bacterium]|nr:MAG: hypothetical protein EA408_02920 [Marinilabiliales bacterium]